MARIELKENEFMQRFVGPDHIDSNDVQFWYQLLSCSFNFMRVNDPKVVDKTLTPFIDLLAINNSQSFNIGSLLRVAIDRISRVKSQSGQSTNVYYVYQSFNALYLLRSICKNYIENTSEDKLIQSFRAVVEDQPTSKPISQLPPPPVLIPKQSYITNAQATTTTIVNSLSGEVVQPQPPPPPQQLQQSLDQPLPGPAADQSGIQLGSQAVQNNVEQIGTIGYKTNDPTSSQVQNKKADFTSGTTMLDQFISKLIEIIVDIPLNDTTYLLQVEAINSLLVLLSVQMYSSTCANQSIIFKSLMHKKCSIHALVLTKTLLNNFIRQDPMPQESGSIIIGLASGLWKVLTLGYGSHEDETTETMSLLARQSLLLTNVLTNHYTSEKNPYREAIISCQDSRFNPSDPQMALDSASNDLLATAATSQAILTSNNIKIEFHELYETICKHLQNDQVALLLYLLLHSNRIFKPYILTVTKSRLDLLVLPLLKVLHSSIQKGSHHVYMVLIIFVILSEMPAFNESIHKIVLRGVPWFKDRLLSEITLGSFTTLIMIRTFQFNTFRVRDRFLHTNLFATLGNLSNYFEQLHPYVCQRLMDLLERLTKRYMMVTKPNEVVGTSSQRPTLDVFSSNNQLAKALATDSIRQNMQDASSIELDSTANYGNGGGQIDQNGGTTININIPDQQLNMANNVIPPHPDHAYEYSPGQDGGQQPPSSNNSISDHINISIEDAKIDSALIEDVIRMVLEVINNSLAIQLANNSDLIYTMLYKRIVFSNLLSSHQSFYNMVINIERILTFFYNEIEAFERQLTVDEIKDLIQKTSPKCCFDQNRDPNSQLLFRYVEDEQPEEFFIPYMWTKIYYSSGIVWNPKRIVLFNPEIL